MPNVVGNQTYSLRIFRVYIMWTRLFTTAVIPVALLLYFNSRIFIDLLNSKVPERGDIRGGEGFY